MTLSCLANFTVPARVMHIICICIVGQCDAFETNPSAPGQNCSLWKLRKVADKTYSYANSQSIHNVECGEPCIGPADCNDVPVCLQSLQVLAQAQAAQQMAQAAAQHQAAQTAAQQQAAGQQAGPQGQDGNQSEPTGFTYRNRARRKASEKPHVRLPCLFVSTTVTFGLCGSKRQSAM